jgi:HEPN domain-containing protein
MRPIDDVLRDLVRQWLEKADLDYQAGAQLLEAGDRLRQIVAFHCQQAVEKYLKALLVRHQVEFPKTHNLRQLLDLASAVAPAVARSLDRCATLTPYGVDIRYPGDLPDLSPGQDTQAFELARLARETVLGELKTFLAGER